MKPNPNPEV